MIPYEDLVVALQTWRARQGLPVTQLSGSLTPPPGAPTTRSAPPPMTTQVTQVKPPAPPPPTRPAPPAAPPPLERPSTEGLDVEDAALLDDGHYENEGDNFSMKFAEHEVEHDAESTNVAGDIEGRLTDPHLGGAGPTVVGDETIELPDPKHSIRSGNRNDDW
jgi:hypothetical protein